jgi:SAM-dependent methyltransferase
MNAREPIDCDDEEARIAPRFLAAGDPTGWFEELYAAGESGRITMPWSRREPHALLVDWAETGNLTGDGRRAIVVGCGLGADAEYIAGRGFQTIGFDISEAAVRIARHRHPASAVQYVQADLLEPLHHWLCGFDLVVEIITVQALPDPPRGQAIANVSRLVGTAGTLLVIAAVHDDDGMEPPPPWPLRREEIEAFAGDGLTPVRIEIRTMPGTANEQRWRAEFQRTAGQPGSSASTPRFPQITTPRR